MSNITLTPSNSVDFNFLYMEKYGLTHVFYTEKLGQTKEVKHYLLEGDHTQHLESILSGTTSQFESITQELLLDIKEEQGYERAKWLVDSAFIDHVQSHQVIFFIEKLFESIAPESRRGSAIIPQLRHNITFLDITRKDYNREVENSPQLIKTCFEAVTSIVCERVDDFELQIKKSIE